MRIFLAVFLVALADSASAAPDAADITRAKAWVTAMHDNNFTAAASTTALPLTFDEASPTTVDAVVKAFAARATEKDSFFRKPKWKATSAHVQSLSAREASKESMSDTAASALKKLSKDHHFVRVTLTEPTSSTSERFITYLIAEQPSGSIDLIATGGEALAN